MDQLAVFSGPSLTSSITSNLNAAKSKNGVHCTLVTPPEEPVSGAVINKGVWEEVSSNGHQTNAGSNFVLDLDATDDAATQLVSHLETKRRLMK